jgi:hypothetical protein
MDTEGVACRTGLAPAQMTAHIFGNPSTRTGTVAARTDRAAWTPARCDPLRGNDQGKHGQIQAEKLGESSIITCDVRISDGVGDESFA